MKFFVVGTYPISYKTRKPRRDFCYNFTTCEAYIKIGGMRNLKSECTNIQINNNNNDNNNDNNNGMGDSRGTTWYPFCEIYMKCHDGSRTLAWVGVNEGSDLLLWVLLKEKVLVTISLSKNFDFRVS